MPRNSSGIYTLPGGNPVTPGDVIEAEWANTTLEDVADALTNSLSRTGAGGMLAPFRIANGSVTAPGLSFLNETNTGLYRAGAGSTWMSVLGVNTVQFSTVGLTIPSGKSLTAQGATYLTSTLAVTGASTMASTLAVTGAITATGGVSGNVTGNVTAATGTSTFNDVVITGALDMTSGSSATITGLSTPVNPSDAANKAYVDSQTGSYLALTGGTMAGAIAMGNNKITGLATPTADADGATKAYVDSVAQGLDAKASCRASTTANITLSGAQTIDGVAVIAGDRVLVQNQSSAAQNGIYVAAAGAWARSSDANTWDSLVAAYTFIESGTVNGNNGFICTIAPGGTLGTTPVTWAQFSGAGQVIAGTGMSKTGNTLNVNTASASRIVVGADDIDLATTGVTASTYKSVTVDAYGRVTGGTNPTTLAGYGISDAYTTSQVDSALTLKLNLTGGTMSGVIAMGANKITGLADPTLAQDAATKNYIDTIFGSTTTAAASAAAAASSASAASSSASSASGSASAAAASATSAAASFDSFDDRYLGAKTSDPTVDNDGNALITGALYFNSVANEMRVYNGSAWLASYIPATGYAQLAATNTFTANQVITDNSSSAALKITQTGSGNALYIEDVAADATPFVVSSTGAVGIGTTTPDNVTSAGIALVSNSGYYPQVVNRNKTNDASASYLVFDKDRAGAVVQSGDNLGNIVFRSFDGANYLQSAAIIGYSDGTPGTNDVPGRLAFLTTADGASSPTERFRISNIGAWGLSGANYGSAGQVLTSAGAGAAPTWSTPAVTSPAGSTGQVQYNNAGAFGALSSGTSGQVLTSGGAGAAPTWASPASTSQIGDVIYSTQAPDSNWLLCNGGIYSQSTYTALYAKLGLIGPLYNAAVLSTTIPGPSNGNMSFLYTQNGVYFVGGAGYYNTIGGGNFSGNLLTSTSEAGTYTVVAKGDTIGRIVGNGSTQVAATQSYLTVAYSTNNGTSWSSYSSFYDPQTSSTPDIAYGGGTYVVVTYSGYVYTSTNLSSWTNQGQIFTDTGYGYPQIVYVGGNFVITYPRSSNNTLPWAIFSSSNGVSWTERTNPASGAGNSYNGQAVVANGRAFIFTPGQQPITSTNGTSWSLVTIGTSDNWRSAGYIDGTWIITGFNNSAKCSRDLSTWSDATAILANNNASSAPRTDYAITVFGSYLYYILSYSTGPSYFSARKTTLNTYNPSTQFAVPNYAQLTTNAGQSNAPVYAYIKAL